MKAKEKIMKALTDEWESTRGIARKTGINWYVAYAILTELASNKQIERKKINQITYWRKKQK